MGGWEKFECWFLSYELGKCCRFLNGVINYSEARNVPNLLVMSWLTDAQYLHKNTAVLSYSPCCCPIEILIVLGNITAENGSCHGRKSCLSNSPTCDRSVVARNGD